MTVEWKKRHGDAAYGTPKKRFGDNDIGKHAYWKGERREDMYEVTL